MIKLKLKWKWVILASIILGIFIAVLLPLANNYLIKMTGVSKSPDTSLIYSVKDLYDMAEIYGDSGRAAYIKLRWTFDVIWPFIYTIVLLLWIIKLSEGMRGNKYFNYLFILPVSGVLLDFLENIGASIIMYRYPLESGIIANITPVMTFLKWVTLFASIILVIFLLFKFILNKIQNSYIKNA